MAGLYQFPAGISASFAFQARQGLRLSAVQPGLPLGLRLTNIYSTRSERSANSATSVCPTSTSSASGRKRRFNVSEKLKFTFAADCFNVFNSATALERQADLTSPIRHDAAHLNPRVFRFGVRVEF